MPKLLRAGLAAAALLAGLLPALALDCGHDRSRVTAAICADPGLRAQDAAVAAALEDGVRRGTAPEADLRKAQKAWVVDRDSACATRDRAALQRCLAAQYRLRLQGLASLVPAPPPAPARPADSLPGGQYLSDAVTLALTPDGRYEIRELGGSRQASGRFAYAGGVLTLSDGRGDVGQTRFPLQCRVLRTANGFAVMMGQPQCRPFDGLSFRSAQ